MTTAADQQRIAIAVRVLTLGKKLAPDRFPAYIDTKGNTKTDLVHEWARALSKSPYPPAIWDDAVEQWVKNIDHGRMATTGELLKAAQQVWQRMSTDPAHKDHIEAIYAAQEANRDKQITAGTFAASRGYQPAIQHEKKPVPNEVIERAKRAAAGLPID